LQFEAEKSEMRAEWGQDWHAAESRAEEKCLSLKNESKMMSEELAKANEDLQRLDEEFASARADYENLNIDFESVRVDHSQRLEFIKTQEREISNCQTAVQETTDQLAETSEQLSEALLANEDLVIIRDQLSSELQLVKSEKQNLIKTYDELLVAYHSMESESKEITVEYHRITKLHESNLVHISTLESQVDSEHTSRLDSVSKVSEFESE
jgi:chromosome segregation ATPase